MTHQGSADFLASRSILDDLAADGRLVALDDVDTASLGVDDPSIAHVVEHPLLGMLSMPFEWSFSLLKDAALFHLNLHLDLLDRGFTLTDATAYNVQFVGPRPIFIDHLSIRPYRDGEFWLGHRQFCEQFLNPLLLRSLFDIAHNNWYRGNLEGISQSDLAKLLPLHRSLSWRMLSNVVLPARFQGGKTSDKEASFSMQGRKLPKVGLIGMLKQLRSWIEELTPANTSSTTWANYSSTTTYTGEEAQLKRAFVSEFVARVRPKLVVDLGCNTGDYSKAALESGAEAVFGFDFDHQALDQAHARAKAESLNFLPLFLDAKNPSPDQGWMQLERSGFASRVKADAVLALAFEHHLAIAHNIPIEQVVAWLTSVAPSGIIEFVPKSDPTVQKMLALREDIFPNYTIEAFSAYLASRTKIVRQEQVSVSGRTMFEYGPRDS